MACDQLKNDLSFILPIFSQNTRESIQNNFMKSVYY